MNGQPASPRRCQTSTVIHREHDVHDWADDTGTYKCNGTVTADELTSAAAWRWPARRPDHIDHYRRERVAGPDKTT